MGNRMAVSARFNGSGWCRSGAVNLSYSGSGVPIAVGSYTVTGSFSTSNDYTSATGTSTMIITKAWPTLTITRASVPFTAAPYSAAVTVVGINNVLVPTLDGYGLTLAYYIYEASDSQWHLLTGSAAPPVDVGTYTVTASFPGVELRRSKG